MKKGVLAFTALLFFFAGTASAEPGALTSIRAAIQNSIRPIIEHFDPEATFVLHLPIKSTVKQLPGTPFTYQNLELRDSGNEFVFQEATLNIYSHLSSLPPHTQEALDKAFEGYGIKYKIALTNIPVMKVKYWEELFNWVFRPQSLPLLFAILLFYTVMVAGFVLRRKEFSQARDSISTSLNQLASALGEKSEPMPKFDAQETTPKKEISKEVDSESSLNDRQLFSMLNKQGLLELLADCYWSQADNYASYIWPRLNPKIREELTSEHPWLSNYARYICQLPEENLSLHHDPYYLRPFSLHKFDNDELARVTSAKPSLLLMLPKLRSNKMNVSAQARLQARSIRPLNFLEAEKAFQSLKDSIPRNLSANDVIEVRSVAEEEELLKDSSLNNTDKILIQSLIWARDISKESLQKILNGYSAQSLAQAWIGPKETLDLFAEVLPEKKRNLTLSYLEQIQPSRQSVPYKSLFHAIAKELSHQAKEVISEISQQAS